MPSPRPSTNLPPKPLSIPTRERSEIGASVADRETRTLAMR